MPAGPPWHAPSPLRWNGCCCAAASEPVLCCRCWHAGSGRRNEILLPTVRDRLGMAWTCARRPGLPQCPWYQCRSCRHQMTVTAGTTSCRLPSGFRLLSGGGRQNADQRTRCPSSPPFALMKLVAPLTSAQVDTFSFAAIADWAQDALARGSEIISDGLACCRAVAEVGRIHRPVIVNGRRSQGSGASHCGDKYIYPARSSCELPIKIRATVL